MPIGYDGDPANVAFSSVLSIASSTDTTPIVVTVSGSLPADFGPGAYVDVFDHQTNWHANGVWRVSAVAGSTVTLQSSTATGSGAGGATGFLQPLNATPAFTYPQDGDSDNSASVSNWAQTQADRVQYLYKSDGVAKLAGRRVLTYTGSSDWAAINPSIAPVTYYPINANLNAWSVLAGTDEDGPIQVDSLTAPLAFGGLWTPKDIARVKLKSAGAGPASLSATGMKFLMCWALSPAGIGAPTFTPGTSIPSGWTALPGSTVAAIPPASGNLYTPWSFESWTTSTTFAGTLFLMPVFFSGTLTAGPSVFGVGDADDLLVVEFWRQTGIPQ